VNSAAYVDNLIKQLKADGVPLSEAAWETAKACVGWPYTYGARGAKTTKDGITVRTFDCRGFTYWVLLQIFGWELMGVGCTKQWNNEDNWKEKGTVAEGMPKDTIVCLFYYKKDKNGKRTSTVEHTGLYYNGETCECSKGVQYSKTLNQKWEMWGVPACVSGDIPEPVPPDPDKKPTLRKGDQGAYVTLAQTELLQRGYDLGSYGADGKFGAKTEAAVKAFQRDWGLVQDGVIGTKTWAMLDSTPVKVLYTVTVPHMSLADAEALVKLYPGSTMNKEGDV
jgi:hypothetical protein